MGVLSKPKKTLTPSVFSQDQQILTPIRSFILRELDNVVPKQAIKEIFVVGSITGFKYDVDSDIDVSVYVQPITDSIDPQSYASFLHAVARRQVNGICPPGSTHPINFYIKNYHDNARAMYESADFGVYDLVADKWLRKPPPPQTAKDPKTQFPLELLIAKVYEDQFGKAISNVDIDRIVAMTRSIKQDREFAYERSWGVPRYGFKNILYKTFEKGPHGRVFEEAKKLERARRKATEKRRETYIHKRAASFKDYKNYYKDVIDHKVKVYKAGRELGAPRGQLLMHDWDKLVDPMIIRSYTKFFQERDRSPETIKSFINAAEKHRKRQAHHIRPMSTAPLNVRREILADWYASQARDNPELTLGQFLSKMR